jgi:hypothetical protein
MTKLRTTNQTLTQTILIVVRSMHGCDVSFR